MRFAPLAAAAAFICMAGADTAANAQEPLRFNVRPRSFLDAGRVVQPNYSFNPASAQGQMVSYYVSPPWQNMRDRFGEGTLPNYIGGPFVGAQNMLGPVDFGEPFYGPLN